MKQEHALNILVVEDFPELSDILKQALAKTGSVTVLPTKNLADQMLRSTPFNMVVVKHEPFLDKDEGRDTLFYVERWKEAHPHIFILILNMDAEEPARHSADRVLQWIEPDLEALGTIAAEQLFATTPNGG